MSNQIQVMRELFIIHLLFIYYLGSFRVFFYCLIIAVITLCSYY